MPDELRPYGVVADRDGARRVVVRKGDAVAPLAPLAHAGLLDVPTGTFDQPSLNRLLELGRPAWTAVRERLRPLLDDGVAPLLPLDGMTPVLPMRIGDFVDCYSSLEHATTVGRLFRPDVPDPLPAAWRHLPIAYHGRSGTVVVSGTPIRRPRGQRGPGDFGPERRLDFELELGVVCGPGTPRDADAAADCIFGVVLVNDWSARELQRFEYQPLGPFLGKSFATSISPWVVPIDALPRTSGPVQDPEPLRHLRTSEPWALDLELEVELNGTVITRVDARRLYWSAPQQVAHVASNGANIGAGDLIASGTISGDADGTQGCLLERPGQAFLDDGDTVVLRGRTAGGTSIGQVSGIVLPAR